MGGCQVQHGKARMALNNLNYLDRMMETIYDWLENMIASLNDGEYWHIPADDILIKIDKNKKELVMVMGDKKSDTYQRLDSVISRVGYKLTTSKSKQYFIP